ncbi:hypothetical protein AB1M95_05415 [Sulfitobacter sp. LCG007]
MTHIRAIGLAVAATALLAACADPTPPVAPGAPFLALSDASAEQVPTQEDARQIAALAALLRSLGPGVDPEEAERAARISLLYPRQLRQEYGVTDPPVIHNIKVNSGLRPRGLCWHWAEDMEKRLRSENFRTLDVHRAIANAGNPLRLEHSTALLSAKGAPWNRSVVVDPWRFGGTLFWSKVVDDTRYRWHSQAEVHAMKRKRIEAGI